MGLFHDYCLFLGYFSYSEDHLRNTKIFNNERIRSRPGMPTNFIALQHVWAIFNAPYIMYNAQYISDRRKGQPAQKTISE